jgi:phospholipid transport system substrate-binding protein
MRILTIALSILLAVGAAEAMTPSETVQNRVGEALASLLEAPRGTPASAEQRRSVIRQISDSLFDFTEMSRRTLGRHWAARSAVEQGEFVRLFTDLMARAYLGKIDRYAGESVAYVGERVEGDQASVLSHVTTKKGSQVPIEYRMHRAGDRWAAYDVLIEGVSLVSTYRSQFDRIIQTSSFAELLKRMREKEQESAAATSR